MQKANQFRSSLFHMSEGDILHIILIDETGDTATFTLNTEYDDATNNEENEPLAPTATDASDITSSGFTANWNFSENATGFYLDVATDSAFTSMVVGYDDLDVGFVNEYDITGLGDTITYYYRLRAYNDYGTSDNSNTISLTTLNELVTDYDGNVYTYVTIGSKQWLVENLRTIHYNDGTPIPNLTASVDWVAEDGSVGHDGAYCWYDNDSVTYDDYGILYNWYATDNIHVLAPTGWRIADDDDWNDLATELGGFSVAGGKLKEYGATHWAVPNTGATDTYGFKGLGAGYRAGDGSFGQFQEECAFWINPIIGGSAYALTYNGVELTGYDAPSNTGYSVRCVRDI